MGTLRFLAFLVLVESATTGGAAWATVKSNGAILGIVTALALLGAAVISVCLCWAALWVVAPVAQRDWARNELAETSAALAAAQAQRPSPDFEIAIPYAWFVDRESDGKRYLAFPVEVTNHEASTHLSLRFQFVLQHRWAFPDGGRNLDVTFSQSLRDQQNSLPDPFPVPPQRELEGIFYSEWYMTSGLDFDEDMGSISPSRDRDRLLARVTERISRTAIEIPVPGKWPTEDQEP